MGWPNYIPVPFSSTPKFDAGSTLGFVAFDMTLTGNVVSSTAVNLALGQVAMFHVQQDATGSRTFAWPANIKNPPLVDGAANSVTTGAFIMRQDGFLYPWNGWS